MLIAVFLLLSFSRFSFRSPRPIRCPETFVSPLPSRSYPYQTGLEKLAKLLPEPAQHLAFQSAEELPGRKSDDRSPRALEQYLHSERRNLQRPL
jgi:hypothetical protein